MELGYLKRALSSNETDAKLAEVARMSQQAISKYRNGLSEVENMRFKNAINLIKFQEEKEMNIEQLENYITNYTESGNAIDPILGMNKNDVKSLKETYENGDLFLYDSESYSEYVNDSIEEYASDEKFIASFKNKLDEFESSKSRFVLEDTDGNVYFVK